MNEKVTRLVEQMVMPILEQEGLELVDVEYLKEGGNWFLRVYIDRDGGVDLDACSRVNERLSKLLDKKDPIPGPYILEVSSPGAERPLKTERDLERSIGKLVAVSLYEPVNGSKKHVGRLQGVGETELTIVVQGGQELAIPREKIALIRLSLDDVV